MGKIKSRRLFIFNSLCDTIFIDIIDNGGFVKTFDTTYNIYDIFSPTSNERGEKLFKIHTKLSEIYTDKRHFEYLETLNKAMSLKLICNSYWVRLLTIVDENIIDLIIFSNSYLEKNGFTFKYICIELPNSKTIYSCDPNLLPKIDVPVEIQIVFS